MEANTVTGAPAHTSGPAEPLNIGKHSEKGSNSDFSSESPGADTTQSEGSLDGEEAAQGVTYDGKVRFVIPKTRDVMSQLFLPWHWTLMQVVTWIFFSLNWWSYFAGLPGWFYVGLTLFWRMMYNAGLGLVLKRQSETQVYLSSCASSMLMVSSF